MTLTADVVGDIHSAGDSFAWADPDADIGSFSMSPASAEQVTAQIRTMMDRSWEYIALAYKGRAFVALGYASWDAYVDARLDGCRLCVPRERRAEAVAALAGVQMSVRAIAKLLGVGIGTVHRELTNRPPSGVQPGTPADSSTTLGRDGKSYPRQRQPSQPPCEMCGEKHSPNTAECPWDASAREGRPIPAPDGTHRTASEHPGGRDGPCGSTPPLINSSDIPASLDSDTLENEIVIVDQIQRIVEENVSLADQLTSLRSILMTLNDATWSELLRHRLRRLVDPLRVLDTACSALIEQVDRVANN